MVKSARALSGEFGIGYSIVQELSKLKKKIIEMYTCYFTLFISTGT